MSWQYIMVAQNLIAAFGLIELRHLARYHARYTVEVLAIITAMVYLFGIVFSSLFNEPLLRTEALARLLPFTMVGLCFIGSYYCTHKALELVDASVVSLMSTVNITAVIGFSILFLGEGLHWHQLLGFFILLIALAVMFSAHMSRDRYERWVHSALYSMLASVLFGLAVVIEKLLLNQLNVRTYILFGWGSQLLWALVGLAAYRLYIRRPLQQHSEILRKSFTAGLFRALSALLFIVALVLADNSSLIAVWSGLRVLMVSVLAAWLLHERQFIARKVEVSLMAIVGVALLLW